MKKLLAFSLVFCMLLSVAVFSATAATPTKRQYELIFEENFDSKLTHAKPYWDVDNSTGAQQGAVSFTMGKMNLGKSAAIPLISASGSEEAADFREGILQFDVTWESSEEAWMIFSLGAKTGSNSTDVQINASNCYIRGDNAKLSDSTSGKIGVRPARFQYGHTYRLWFYFELQDKATIFRAYSADVTDGKEPTEESVMFVGENGLATYLTGYEGGGYIKFSTDKVVENLSLDNLKIYAPKADGEKSEAEIIPGFYKIDSMSDEELLVYLGGPTQAEIKATQKLNGEFYNLVFSEDFTNGSEDLCWDANRQVLGSSARRGEVLFQDGELIIGAKALQSIVSAGSGARAAAFSRGIFEFDLTWEKEVGSMQFVVYDHTQTAVAQLSLRENAVTGQHFTGGRVLSTGAEGVRFPEIKADTKYNYKILVEKQPEQNDVLWKIYIAEYDANGKMGKHVLAGWGCHSEKLFNYAGGGHIQLSEGSGKSRLHLDNMKVYEPVNDETAGASVKITSIIPNYNALEAGIEADREVQRDEEGIRMLERIGMIIGEGNGITESYLKTKPTRVQAAVLTLRLRGLEEEAKAFESDDNFADIDNVGWAKNILAYIKAHPELGMVGVGDNCFDPMAPITQQAYLKILLESMGYKYNEDFSWGEVLSFAKDKGIDYQEASEFNVREVAKTTYAALYAKVNGAKNTLFAKIMEDREGICDPEYANAPALTEEYLAMREAAQHKDYGLIVNYDSTETAISNAPYHFGTPEKLGETYDDPNKIPKELLTKENYYAWVFDSLIGKGAWGDLGMSQAKTIAFSTCVNGVGEELLMPDENGFITSSAQSHKDYWAHVLMEEIGQDPVELGIEWCKENGMSYIWSQRMNDNHDMGYGYEGLNSWKANHLDLLMGKYEDFIGDNFDELAFGNKSWSNVDFSKREGRLRVYDTIKYVVQNYDVDGVELDFFRHLCYFKEVVQGKKVYQESIEKMNDLVRAIRKMLDAEGMKRGKAIALFIKIPDSLGYCYNVGLDIDTWMQEDLIDVVGAGGYWRLADWTECVEYFQGKYDVPFYACLSRDIIHTAQNFERWRNEAAVAWESGAKGVSTFNVLQGREKILRFIGSPETAGVPAEGYEDIKFNLEKGRYWPGQWLRDGVSYRWVHEAFPEDWSSWSHGQKLYD